MLTQIMNGNGILYISMQDSDILWLAFFALLFFLWAIWPDDSYTKPTEIRHLGNSSFSRYNNYNKISRLEQKMPNARSQND